ncbi:unnamed protein product [Caenorhabditis brenneri]
MVEMTKEEMISDHFVQVEMHLNNVIQLCDNSSKTYESAEWNKEKKITLLKFDGEVKTAEGSDEAAKDVLLYNLRTCLIRIRFAEKLAQFGVFVLFDGPGKLFPVPGCIHKLFKGRAYERL